MSVPTSRLGPGRQLVRWVRQLLLIYAFSALASGHAHAGARAGIALVPSQWAVTPRRSLADVLSLDRDALYLFREGSTRPVKWIPASNTLIERAEVSPDLRAVAYRFTYPDPAKIDVVIEHRTMGVRVVNADGRELRQFLGAAVAAWSPSSHRLAVANRKRMYGEQDTIRVWDLRTGRVLSRQTPGYTDDLVWRSEDTLVVGSQLLVASTGALLPNNTAGPRISPDRQYSIDAGERAPGILDDARKVDISVSVFQVCGAQHLKLVRRMDWLPGTMGPHLAALAIVDSVQARDGSLVETERISIIDVSIPELVATVPGRLLRISPDGKQLVVLREDGIHFLDAPRRGQIGATQLVYGSGLGPRPAEAWIQMISYRWAHRFMMDRLDTLEMRTLGVRPGDWISVQPFGRADSLRAVGIRSNGCVLMESSRGLVPMGGRYRDGFGYRFIVTSRHQDVGTPSSDAGYVFCFRVIPEAMALEHFRKGTELRKGGSLTTFMGKPYTPPRDTTFDEPPRVMTPVIAWMPRPWRKDVGDHLVYVTAQIDASGRVSGVDVALRQQQPHFEAAIKKAALGFRFKPAQKSGHPVRTPWGFNVEFKHPRSGELAAPEDTASTVWLAGLRVGARIRSSAYYDSVDEKYCYSYILENCSKGRERIVSLSLMGCDPGLKDESENPEKWNGFFCGDRPGMMGWQIWEKDLSEGFYGACLKPGAVLSPLKFKTKAPPGRVQWAAQTTTHTDLSNIGFPCPGSRGPNLGAVISGTIMGPAGSASVHR